jgi:F0F1-type ATP synthase assembly protein I
MDGEKPVSEREATAAQTAAEAEALRQTRLRLIGLSLQFGFTIVGAIIIFLGGGIWLDRRMGTTPIFLLIGLVLAFIAIGYNLYEIATIGYKPRARSSGPTQPKPATTTQDNWAEPQDDWDRDKEQDDDWPVRRTDDKSGGR